MRAHSLSHNSHNLEPRRQTRYVVTFHRVKLMKGSMHSALAVQHNILILLRIWWVYNSNWQALITVLIVIPQLKAAV